MFSKKSLTTLLVFSSLLCIATIVTASDSGTQQNDTLQLTIGELKTFDGKNGNKAYVVIDSVIYDVSKAKSWKNGEHKMGLQAGNDQTDKILKSPHKKQVLAKLPVVGKLIASPSENSTGSVSPDKK